jgi:CBS domain-containing protein
VDSRLTTLPHDGSCRSCGTSLRSGTTAWFDAASDAWACRGCGPETFDDPLEDLGEAGVLILHGRSAPTTRGTIDHVVVARSGVWVVDSKYHGGRVAVREGTEKTDRALLFVGKHNVTPMVENLRWQTEAVRAALTPIGFDDVPVLGVLCFAGAEWGWFPKPIQMQGLVVTWPDHLLAEIARTVVIGASEIDFIGRHLESRLVVKR